MARKQSAKARAAPASPPRADRTRLWRATGIAVVVLAAIAAHARSLPGTFIWDDQQMIPEHKWIVSLVTEEALGESSWQRLAARWNLQGLVELWTSDQQPDYWPVSYTTHWLEYRLFGPWAPGYRAVNLLLHVVNSLLVWRLTARLVPSLAGVPAFLCALLFAVHPLSVEAVAWLLQRKTLLSTCFALAAIDAYLNYDERHESGWLTVAIVLFALGMLAKTSIVTLPAMLLVLSIWRHGRLRAGDWLATLPFFGVALVLGWFAYRYQQDRSIAEAVVRDDNFLSRFALAGWAIWFYLSKALWPVGLCFNYVRWTCDTTNPLVYVPSAAWLALGGGLLAARRRLTGGPFVAWSWYSLLLFPALGFVNIYFMKYSLVADHWQYTALPAVIVLAIALGKLAVDHAGAAARVPALATVGVVALVLLAISVQHSAAFAGSDNKLLWLDTLAKNPSAWSAHNNLATLLGLEAVDPQLQIGGADVVPRPATPDDRQALWQRARTHYAEAVRIAPREVSVRTNYGRAMFALGDRQAAREQFIVALRLCQEVAARARQQGRDEQAAAITRDSAELECNLGQFASTEGQREIARRHYLRALELDPRHAEANLNYGQQQFEDGNLDLAEKHLRAALATKPHAALAHLNLGIVLWRKQQHEEAVKHVRLALALDPQDRVAQQVLQQMQTGRPAG
ncbi:MAG: tetratricopeptide repeat protein [Pirellulales bacterium]|nr:tetratricopeptide repeat protein [Pirellulales bacterium]